jgi:integrase
MTKKGGIGDAKLKTDAAFRVVPLHDFAHTALQEWLDTGWAAWTGREPGPEDYVFPNADGDAWRPRAAEDVRFDCAIAGVPSQYKGHNLGEHALRRTFSTLLHVSGVAMPTITEVLGHSDGSTAVGHYVTMYLAPHYAAIKAIKGEYVYGVPASPTSKPKRAHGWEATMAAKAARNSARHRGFEPLAYGSGGRRSIQLS